jgi:hypothetical protein
MPLLVDQVHEDPSRTPEKDRSKMRLGYGNSDCCEVYVKRIQIERKSKVVPADIARQHLWGVGKPVIITDATENWRARSKWTFEFLKTA